MSARTAALAGASSDAGVAIGLSPAAASASGSVSALLVSNSVTASVSWPNAVGYTWTYVSGNASISCPNPNQDSTLWVFVSGSPGTFVAYWRCAVGDLITGLPVGVSAEVPVTFTVV